MQPLTVLGRHAEDSPGPRHVGRGEWPTRPEPTAQQLEKANRSINAIICDPGGFAMDGPWSILRTR